MKEKNQEKKELCAIPRELVAKKLEELVSNPATKAVLDEYFMWVSISNSPITVVGETIDEKSSK